MSTGTVWSMYMMSLVCCHVKLHTLNAISSVPKGVLACNTVLVLPTPHTGCLAKAAAQLPEPQTARPERSWTVYQEGILARTAPGH